MLSFAIERTRLSMVAVSYDFLVAYLSWIRLMSHNEDRDIRIIHPSAEPATISPLSVLPLDSADNRAGRHSATEIDRRYSVFVMKEKTAYDGQETEYQVVRFSFSARSSALSKRNQSAVTEGALLLPP